MTATHIIYLLVFSIAIAYLALRHWFSAPGSVPIDGISGFDAQVGFTMLDGMQSISLLLENESTAHVWVEEIEISLTDLAANAQTVESSCHEVLKILQVVGAQDALPISLAGLIYKAAGGPQREYSCTLAARLRFRIGENRFERDLGSYRVGMVGLTASGIRRERKRKPQFQPTQQPQGVATAAAGKFK
jgi:hypothetical protein